MTKINTNPYDKIRADKMSKDKNLARLTSDFINESAKYNYSYNYSWLGRPIIQYPQDIVAMQELIWTVKPDLIIETGIAHGGSLIMNASLLMILDYCDSINKKMVFEPDNQKRCVLGIDIDIREHNKIAIESHPLNKYITMIEGSSVDEAVIEKVYTYAENYQKILVILDSNHTHNHVLAELNAYSSLVTIDSYCIVFDTVIEDMGNDMFPDRPWGKSDNPKTAVWEFLEKHPEYEIDKNVENKLLITVAPDGYLKRIS